MARGVESLRKGVTIIFAGPPGSGKGTYGKILAKRWGFGHVSIGDLIRSQLPNPSFGMDSKSLADRGLLLPDNLAAEICKQYIRSHPEQRSWILDGFPRTLPQAEMVREFARPHACVNFHLPKYILLQKLLGRRICNICGANFNMADIHDKPYEMPAILPRQDCNECKGDAPLLTRVDDTVETIQKRLDAHEKTTRPMIDEYNAEGILLNFEVVKGIGDIARLESTIFSFLQHKYKITAEQLSET